MAQMTTWVIGWPLHTSRAEPGLTTTPLKLISNMCEEIVRTNLVSYFALNIMLGTVPDFTARVIPIEFLFLWVHRVASVLTKEATSSSRTSIQERTGTTILVEVKGIAIKVVIDGVVYLDTTDSRFVSGG